MWFTSWKLNLINGYRALQAGEGELVHSPPPLGRQTIDVYQLSINVARGSLWSPHI